MAAKLTRLTHK